MKKVSLAFAAIVALTALANSPLAAREIDITVAPNVINIGSETEVVTVHTDIPYGIVEGSTVTLNGIVIASSKYDNRGNFVAKFDAIAVKEIIDPGTATLELVGSTKDGESFSGSDTVKVINIIPKKR